MKIEILGSGCTKCQNLESVVQQAVSKIGGFHEVTKVKDLATIISYNVIATPALVIDGEVKSTGKVLNIDEVITLLQKG